MVVVSISLKEGRGRSLGAFGSPVQQQEAVISAKEVATRAEMRRIMERLCEVFLGKTRAALKRIKDGPLQENYLEGAW